uniref:Uncharacterized protein n=1 Tax=Anopheles culicifacies TaxID=139723 RepID=A0A182MSW9_9DIPT
MSIMCTIVAVVLASSLLLVSIAFIGASSRIDDGQLREQLQKRETNDGRAGVWEFVKADTVAPQTSADRMMRFGEFKKKAQLNDEEDPLKAENSHVVVQVYSVDSDQEVANESSGSAIRTLKVENFITPKEHMDGKSTDRVERKVLAPSKNVKVESEEKEDLLSEQFFVDETEENQEPKTASGRRPSFGSKRPTADRFGPEQDHLPPMFTQSSYANPPPFFDYNEQTSQRMLDEFFAQRNQDALAARRSNYDWGEGQLRSRTLESIKNQNRASAASRKKTPTEYSKDDDMSYDRYADYAEAEQRTAGYTAQKLGRKQRATPSTGGQTHVLNKVPIVAYDGDGSMAPMYKSDNAQRSQFERSRFHYSLPSMVYNPYAWDPYHMNMLRFPQCNACQQNARALCSKCGLCADCCAHSKCTCGCLNG